MRARVLVPGGALLLALATIALAAPLVAAPPSKAAKGPPPPKSFLEAELATAQTIDLYLVLRPKAKALEIRARGVTLATVPVEQVALLRYRAPRGTSSEPGRMPFFYWTVAEDPEAAHRKVIAPAELRPYSEQESAEEEQSTQVPVATAPAGAAEPLPTPPTDYKIALDLGWQLWVTGKLPDTSLLARLKYAFAEGWGRLRGKQPDIQDRVVLVFPPAEAQRMHHLFRAGTRIYLDPTG